MSFFGTEEYCDYCKKCCCCSDDSKKNGDEKEDLEIIKSIFGNNFLDTTKKLINIEETEKPEILSSIFKGIIETDHSSLENINIEDIKKEGSYGQIFKVPVNNFIFCVKLKKEEYNKILGNEKTSLEREIANLDILQVFPNFLSFYGGYVFKNRVFICTEYCDNEDLVSFWTNVDPTVDKDNLYKNFSEQFFSILKTLRENKITHRDIKLENFFVKKESDNYKIVLGNFGKSSPQYKETEVDKNLQSTANCGCYDLKSPIFKQYYIAKHQASIKKSMFSSFNAYNEDLFGVAVILFCLKNGCKYPNFVSNYNVFFSDEEKLNGFEEDLKNFEKYFESDAYKNHENEIYNKIFVKFKDKKDNSTIDISEFINEVDSQKI